MLENQRKFLETLENPEKSQEILNNSRKSGIKFEEIPEKLGKFEKIMGNSWNPSKF